MNDSSLCDVDLDIRSVRVRYAGRMVGTLALTADGVLAFEYDDGWISAFSLRGDIRSTACSACLTTACPTDGGVCWSIGCFDLTASIRSP